MNGPVMASRRPECAGGTSCGCCARRQTAKRARTDGGTEPSMRGGLCSSLMNDRQAMAIEGPRRCAARAPRTSATPPAISVTPKPKTANKGMCDLGIRPDSRATRQNVPVGQSRQARSRVQRADPNTAHCRSRPPSVSAWTRMQDSRGHVPLSCPSPRPGARIRPPPVRNPALCRRPPLRWLTSRRDRQSPRQRALQRPS